MQNIFRVALIVGLVLLIPLFGNTYIEGWNWSPSDFVIMGLLLLVVGLAIDLAWRKVADPTNRLLAVGGIVLVFLALWTEMAVGAVSQLLAFFFS